MSKQMGQEAYKEKINKIYSLPNIQILEWNGYTKRLKYYCYKCGTEHEVNDARNLLTTASYCKENLKTNKKFSVEDFFERLNKIHGKKIDIIQFNGLSNPLVYKCPVCQEIKTIAPARMALSKFSLCDNCDGVEKNKVERKIKEIFDNNPKYELLSYRGVKKKSKIKCKNCGAIFERYPSNIIICPDTCPNCNNGSVKQKLDINVIQKRIDDDFGTDAYTILDYQGQLKKTSKIKCNSCGLIFSTQLSTFTTKNSRGCPKCKRFKSKGEQLVEKYLLDNNIRYEAQKRFKECNNNLSSFDFCAYDRNNKMYLIEVNGIQHYKPLEHFGSFETIQKRDSIKINFCKSNNIPLIVIPYTDLEYSNLDKFLYFLKGSTTIPEGSREQANGSPKR